MLGKIIILTIIATPVFAQQKFSGWNAYGGDAGGTRYSSLTQINESNVHTLKPAWTFRTGELETYKGTNAIEKAAFEATPILIDNTLYFSTPSCRVFALEPSTGKQKWMYDPKLNLKNF
jgi:quinoprotein glucose dehydrogenase